MTALTSMITHFFIPRASDPYRQIRAIKLGRYYLCNLLNLRVLIMTPIHLNDDLRVAKLESFS